MNPTKKQIEFIGAIEETTGHLFKGETKEEARKFISEHYKVVESREYQLNYMTSDWALENGYF